MIIVFNVLLINFMDNLRILRYTHIVLQLDAALSLTIRPGANHSLAGVLECAMHLPLPFEGRIVEPGLVEFHPVKYIFTFPLAGNAWARAR